jgi:uncharacterized protein YndB with AHSA1/START domain
MDKLFIDKTVEIDAPAAKVWAVLTEREYTDQWVAEFSPGMHLISDWQLGSQVFWNDPSGKTVVEGNVTKVEPGKSLRFTVFDVELGRTPVTEEDGMTFELMEKDGKTTLHLLHGDFAILAEAQKYYDMTLEAWNNILPKIKELSEK